MHNVQAPRKYNERSHVSRGPWWLSNRQSSSPVKVASLEVPGIWQACRILLCHVRACRRSISKHLPLSCMIWMTRS